SFSSRISLRMLLRRSSIAPNTRSSSSWLISPRANCARAASAPCLLFSANSGIRFSSLMACSHVRKPRKPPEPVTGTAVWITPLDIEHGCPGQVVLATEKLATRYSVQVIRSLGCKHFGGQIVGFRLTNEASGAVYDIDTTPVWGWTCDCPDAEW